MKWVFAALFLSIISGTAHAQTTSLKRLGTENEARSWEAVGRLELAGRGFCTARLISSDTVLTAAHCVYDGKTGRLHDATPLSFALVCVAGRRLRSAMWPNWPHIQGLILLGL